MEPAPSEHVWLDGRFVASGEALVPVTTHALHYGTSAFEGIRAYWNSEDLLVFRLDDHIRRLRRSGGFYGMSLRHSDAEIRGAVLELCRRNALRENAYIRPFHFVGGHGISLHVDGDAPTSLGIYAFPLGDLFDKGGISAGVSSWRRFSDSSAPPQAKMGGNYLNAILATREAVQNGYDEALLLDQDGNLSEAPGENVFLVRDGGLVTPPASSSALEGLTRGAVIEMAGDLGIKVTERDIPRSEIHLADEVFLSGTAAEITPVRSVDRRAVGGGGGAGAAAAAVPGEVTRRIMAAYDDAVMNRSGAYARWVTGVYR